VLAGAAHYVGCLWSRKRQRALNALLQGTLFGLFFVVVLVQIAYLATSWDYTMSVVHGVLKNKHEMIMVVIFFVRVALLVLIAFFLALLRCEPVSKEEQVCSPRCLRSSWSCARPCI
jgi:hypothetical protein